VFLRDATVPDGQPLRWHHRLRLVQILVGATKPRRSELLATWGANEFPGVTARRTVSVQASFAPKLHRLAKFTGRNYLNHRQLPPRGWQGYRMPHKVSGETVWTTPSFFSRQPRRGGLCLTGDGVCVRARKGRTDPILIVHNTS
jgi:hypothetical protein